MVRLFLLEPFAAAMLADEPALVVLFLQMFTQLCFLFEVNTLHQRCVLICIYNSIIQIFIKFVQTGLARYNFFMLSFYVFPQLVPIWKRHVAALLLIINKRTLKFQPVNVGGMCT